MKSNIKLVILSSFIALNACRPDMSIDKYRHTQISPSVEIKKIITQFVKSDSLQTGLQLYVVFIKQDSTIGRSELHLISTRHASVIKHNPSSISWQVAGETIFVYSGLEGVVSSQSYSDNDLLDRVESLYAGSHLPPSRIWKIFIENNRIISIDKRSQSFDPLNHPQGPPPPLPKY